MIAPLFAIALALAPSAFAETKSKTKLGVFAIHSDDYALIRKGGVIEQWTGKVYYHEYERDVWADWAEHRKDDDRWTLRGRVRAVWRLQDKTVLEAKGHEVLQDGERETGSLKPLPGRRLEFQRQRPEREAPERGEAEKLSWDMKANRMTLEGRVRTWGPSGTSWSDRAVYDTTRRKLDLSGSRPVLVSGAKDWNGAVQADRVIAADNPREVIADGKVRGWVIFADRPDKLKGL
ncbi:MAG: hypothetical protein HY925_05425 [Elusimicrobia bacterium]|nr:hypothetical protein [Elusimicrobiota bacterium]